MDCLTRQEVEEALRDAAYQVLGDQWNFMDRAAIALSASLGAQLECRSTPVEIAKEAYDQAEALWDERCKRQAAKAAAIQKERED